MTSLPTSPSASPDFNPLVGHRARLNSRGYRVRYSDEVQYNDGAVSSLMHAPERDSPYNYQPPEWRIPVYDDSGPYTGPIADEPLPPHLIPGGGIPYLISRRRGSDESDITLNEEPAPKVLDTVYNPVHRRSINLQPPSAVYFDGQNPQLPPGLVAPLRIHKKSKLTQSKSLLKPTRSSHILPGVENYDPQCVDDQFDMPAKGKKGSEGIIATLADLYNSENYDEADYPPEDIERNETISDSVRAGRMIRTDSNSSDDSLILDPDDPKITGVVRRHLDDREDLEKNILCAMSYRGRRKERARLRIEFNITSVLHRQKFLMRLAKALMTYGAPSHRIEAQLLSAARILEIDGEFIHIPGVIICSFGDQDMKTSETHFVKCGGRLSLGSLHEVHQIYRAVVHDEMSAKKGTERLDKLLDADPLYGFRVRCLLAFVIASLICPLAFGGSVADMFVAGAGAMFLCFMQVGYASKSQLYANVFEVTMTMTMSFLARALSSIHGNVFCYTAISSASIVGILPGFLILSSSLELASKNLMCGSVKMVYALIYTLFLGFGLQIGSDIYLLLDPQSRHSLAEHAANFTTPDVAKITGMFVSDNGTALFGAEQQMLSGTFTFTDAVPIPRPGVFKGCYRPADAAWYMQPFPWWTQFFIVPIFSIFSSLSNLQPLWTWEMVVMVVISCCAYAANKIADHFIFNRSDVVSCIGAIAVGLLGNLYSRNMGGTAFTSMVTGVLFLVPSGLSQIGGLTAQGSGVDIGAAMIAVVIGITVGLFLSQAIVYAFGKKKNAAMFSF